MLKFLLKEFNDLSNKNTIIISIVLLISTILTMFSAFSVFNKEFNVAYFNLGVDALKVATAILLYGYSSCILLNIIEKRQRN